MPEHIALPLRPIIKNRLNADLRHVNYYSAYIRRKAKNAGDGQKTAKYKHISGTMYKSMFSRSSAAIQADRPNTGQHTETADQNTIQTADSRKYINHSGIIGNAIPGSEKSAESVGS